jgi:hypothetical protein
MDAGPTDRLDIGVCSADRSRYWTTRLTTNIDTINGVWTQDREVTYQGEYASSIEAEQGFSMDCATAMV